MLGICSKKEYKKYENLCRIDDEQENMHIILKGKVSILFKLGFELQNITPVGIVGEMGIFTGEKCSATITAVTDCIALKFDKAELFKLFSSDIDLYNKVLLNVIKDLSTKIRKNNEQLDEALYQIRASYNA